MSNVLILCGGNSFERDVSLRSGDAVRTALISAGDSVVILDTAIDLKDAEFAGYDAIFIALHGAGGEDGVIQKRLESLGHSNFVGSDAISSALCFDKWRYKQLLDQNHINCPRGAVVTAAEFMSHPLITAPFVLKPFDGGSSVDTHLARDITTVDFDILQTAFERNPKMLLEELIEGIEITVGVLDNDSLSVIEIIPPSGGEFDYENKYNGATQELCPPHGVSEQLQAKAKELAERIHKACGCRDMSRTDMMIDAEGSIWVLETNTIPGLTDESLLPKAAASAGIGMTELCSRLVSAAAQRI